MTVVFTSADGLHTSLGMGRLYVLKYIFTAMPRKAVYPRIFPRAAPARVTITGMDM